MKKVRYRIKIITYKNGRQEFTPQFKSNWFTWLSIGVDGELCGTDLPKQTRNSALYAIDKHYSGNKIVKTIDFEYFTK